MLIYDTPLSDTDVSTIFALLQSRMAIKRRRLAEAQDTLPPPPPPPPALQPPPIGAEARSASKARRRLQQAAVLLQQDLTSTLAAAAKVPTTYVTVTEVPLAGGTAFDCSLDFPENATSLAIAFYGLINMYPNQIFGSGWTWPMPVLSSSVQITGLALTWTAPPSPPIVRLPPPPPPPLSPPSPGPLVLTLAPSFAVAQWAVDQIACDSSGCTPYDRRIEYEPVASNVSSWNAMKGMPFSVVLTASRAIAGVTTASLAASGFRVTQVVELSPGRQYLFDLVPSGTGNFSLSVPASAVTDLGLSRRRLLASSPATASNSLTVAHDDTPPKPSFQYQ